MSEENQAETPGEQLPTRTLYVNGTDVTTDAYATKITEDPSNPIPGFQFDKNHIQTSKYTWWNFLPKNLIEQFSKTANQYFAFIAILQCIPSISISGGMPTIALPLCFVLFVSGLKDWFEDSKKKKADREDNQRPYLKYKDQRWVSVESQSLQVGDLVQVIDNQRFPADILLVGVHAQEGEQRTFCYVETSNIDGETNLKLKMVHNELSPIGELDEEGLERMKSYKCKIHADAPNSKLEEWRARIEVDGDKQQLNASHLLLRGSELRNSGCIYGIVVYTGFKSKIFMNNQARNSSIIKISRVEAVMQRMIWCMAIMQFCFCLLLGVCDGLWMASNEKVWYLQFDESPITDALKKFFTWFIIFNQFIPISLMVSLEVTRFGQMYFMQWDWKMTKVMEDTGDIRGLLCKPAHVQNSRLNEELGMVEFIFSDKTGTLTENSLDFRKCVIGSQAYGTGTTEIGRAAKRRKNQVVEAKGKIPPEHLAKHVFFDQGDDVRGMMIPDPKEGSQEDMALMFGRNLALNNTCFPVWEKIYTLAPKENECIRLVVNGDRIAEQDTDSGLLSNSTVLSINDKDVTDLSVEEINDLLSQIENPAPDVSRKIELKSKLERPEFKASSPDDQCLVNFAHFIGVSLLERRPPFVKIEIKTTNGTRVEEWEQLQLLDFASAKKRMSVIMRHKDTGRIYAFIKGADSAFIELQKDWMSEPNREFTTSILTEYAEEGLRTLLLGCSELSEDWWKEWNPRFKDAEQNLQPNTHERFDFDTEVDAACDYKLTGATAIEDKLQHFVPETISAFLEAGMRVWILTGDKLETAKNIGVACDLLDPDMEEHGYLFTIDGKSKDSSDVTLANVESQITEALDKMRKIEQDAESDDDDTRKEAEHILARAGLVLTSGAFRKITHGDASGHERNNDSELIGMFLDLALLVKSVVACRLQPNQKKDIVDYIGKKQNVITLAVGDGANDEPMIKQAHVGVGIAGLEGTAAVRASDYAIGQFSFLRRLLFVHGRNCYRRNSVMIYYILYKNAVGCFTFFWFAFKSGFSGQPLYLDFAWQLYNVAYTAFPIFAYALFDKDAEDNDLETHPDIYHHTNGNLRRKNIRRSEETKPGSCRMWTKADFDGGNLFQLGIFVWWIAESLLTSAIITWCTLASWENITSGDSTGKTYGLWTFGLTIYTSVILVVNLRLFFVFESWTFAHIIALCLSLIFYILSLLVFSSSSVWSAAGCDYKGILFVLFKIERFWLTCLLTSVVSLMMFSVVISYSRLFNQADALSKRLTDLREQRRQDEVFHTVVDKRGQ